MAERIDGWRLLARIASNSDAFASCDATVGLVALLLVRSQLVQGVASRADLDRLAAAVGPEAMREVIGELGGYEVLRVVSNMGEAESDGERRSAEGARKHLIDIVSGDAPGAPQSAEPAGQPAARLLRRHRAMGARRIRTAQS